VPVSPVVADSAYRSHLTKEPYRHR
jgi:hypothetical protein